LALPGTAPRRRALIAIGCAVAAGTGAMLILGNAQPSGLPLMAIAALLILDELTLAIGSGRVDGARGALLLCFVLLAAATTAVMDAAGIAYALADKAVHGKAGARLDAPHLSALRFFGETSSDEGNENGRALARLTAEGVDLAKRHAYAGESVRGLAAVNPFSYALLSRPSNGGAVSITERKVSETVVPPLAALVGDVDLILAPKFSFSETRTIAIVLRRYPDLLGGRYLRVADSENWTLYRKRSVR
jgi:hypothetical protein